MSGAKLVEYVSILVLDNIDEDFVSRELEDAGYGTPLFGKVGH